MLLNQLAKMYVENMIDELRNSNDSDYNMGYGQALYNVMAANGYNYDQIKNATDNYKLELNYNEYLKTK